MTVRTRVAPSPTGDPHVGTAYMALFCQALAKRHGGEFVLRIEDTDAARSTPESEQNILGALKWLGLSWDEGPDVGGPHGPYRQSERLDIYRDHVDHLLEGGHAFHCFCTAERLDEMRREQMGRGETARYDGLCASLSAADVKSRLDAGESSVVRMKVPDAGTCVVKDELRGDIEIDYAQIDMQVLMKSDGFPTYHLAVVVDDHLMNITHIVRGEEWINSAPKHLLLYQYFGWDMPKLVHMPLLRNPDKSKLSKRKNPTSIWFYERMGFLPEAILNYLGMMGYSMADGEEKFSLARMIDEFDLERITLGSPVFDVEKLKWLNGRWIREELSDEAIADRMTAWALNRDNLMQVIPLLKERVDIFSQFAPQALLFVDGMPELTEASFEHKKLQQEDVVRILQFAAWELDALRAWDRESIHQTLSTLAERMDLKIRDLLAPLFVAIAGKPVSPPLFDSMSLLGPDMCRARVRHALEAAGGVSKKQAKRLEKEYRSLLDGAGD